MAVCFSQFSRIAIYSTQIFCQVAWQYSYDVVRSLIITSLYSKFTGESSSGSDNWLRLEVDGVPAMRFCLRFFWNSV